MKNLIPACIFWLVGLVTTSVWSQTTIKVDFNTGVGTPVQQVEAVFRPANGPSNGQALLILHHGGGYNDNTTQQYAEYFSSRGFATLELIMFRFRTPSTVIDPIAFHGQVMGGLKYLSQVPGVDRKRVSAMGMSLGAFLTIHATSSWFL
jgi:dienelactone hydrolase